MQLWISLGIELGCIYVLRHLFKRIVQYEITKRYQKTKAKEMLP